MSERGNERDEVSRLVEDLGDRIRREVRQESGAAYSDDVIDSAMAAALETVAARGAPGTSFWSDVEALTRDLVRVNGPVMTAMEDSLDDVFGNKAARS